MNEGVMKNSCSKGGPGAVEKQRKRLNQRQKARILLIFSVAFLAVTAILGVVLHDAAMVTDFSRKNIAPCLKYPFGTDWLGKWEIAKKHIVPHVLPQFIVGLVLLFPHAILHESSITFLGFGLSTEQPAIGVILSESMRYLIMGKWWLAVFPGMMLVLTVVLFEKGGTALRQLLDPGSVHK
jgi:ABC-type dipeptide/oligopeptide/nickel transport system permease subunit